MTHVRASMVWKMYISPFKLAILGIYVQFRGEIIKDFIHPDGESLAHRVTDLQKKI